MMGADKLPEISTMTGFWWVISICIAVQHIANNYFLTIETFVENGGDSWGAGILGGSKVFPMQYMLCAINVSITGEFLTLHTTTYSICI